MDYSSLFPVEDSCSRATSPSNPTQTPAVCLQATRGNVSVQQIPHGHSGDAEWTPSPPVQGPWTGAAAEPPAAGAAAAPTATAAATPAIGRCLRQPAVGPGAGLAAQLAGQRLRRLVIALRQDQCTTTSAAHIAPEPIVILVVIAQLAQVQQDEQQQRQ